jgi:predicted phosphate transport protein (TIGR00153 family)
MALTRDDYFWTSFMSMGERAVDAALVLEQLVKEPAQVETHAKRLSEIERQADEIIHGVMSALHQTWITPLDREEIHALIKSLDDVVDTIDGIGERFHVYGIQRSNPDAIALTQHITVGARAMHDALKILRDMKQASVILDKLKTIGTEEHNSDKILSSALKRLFSEEKDAIEVIKWRDLYERLERVTDRMLDVANELEAIVLEHA